MKGFLFLSDFNWNHNMPINFNNESHLVEAESFNAHKRKGELADMTMLIAAVRSCIWKHYGDRAQHGCSSWLTHTDVPLTFLPRKKIVGHPLWNPFLGEAFILKSLIGSELIKKFLVFMELKVQQVHKPKQRYPVLTQLNPAHTLTSCSCKTHFNIIVPFT
jgi:hypothetical protein